MESAEMGEKETARAAAQGGGTDVPSPAESVVKSKSNITNNRGDEAEGRLAGGGPNEPLEASNLNLSKSN